MEQVIAIFDYSTTDDSTLSFRKGDILTVISIAENGWVDGIRLGKRGWFVFFANSCMESNLFFSINRFPSNYVAPVVVSARIPSPSIDSFCRRKKHQKNSLRLEAQKVDFLHAIRYPRLLHRWRYRQMYALFHPFLRDTHIISYRLIGVQKYHMTEEDISTTFKPMRLPGI